MAVTVVTSVAAVVMPMVPFAAVFTFAVTVAMVTFTVIVPMVTFVAVVGRFLFVTGWFFLRMATTPSVAPAVFTVVVLVEARAFSAAEDEVAAAGEGDGATGADAQNRSREDRRHT